MTFSYRPTARIVVAVVCVLAGIVILWRTFTPPAAPPPRPTPGALAPAATSAAAVPPTAIAGLQSTPYPPAFTATPALQSGLPPLASATPGVQNGITQAPASTSAPTPALPAQSTLPPSATPPVVTQQPTQTPPATIAQPTPAPALAPTAVPTATLPPTPAPTQTATTGLTATATVAQPTTAPANTAVPATATQPVASPTPSQVVVLYKVEGNAPQVVITYIDQFGKEQVLNGVALPWEVSFTAGPSADLAIDAFSDGETDGTLRCTISVNAVVVRLDQTDRSTAGVTCEQFAQ